MTAELASCCRCGSVIKPSPGKRRRPEAKSCVRHPRGMLLVETAALMRKGRTDREIAAELRAGLKQVRHWARCARDRDMVSTDDRMAALFARAGGPTSPWKIRTAPHAY